MQCGSLFAVARGGRAGASADGVQYGGWRFIPNASGAVEPVFVWSLVKAGPLLFAALDWVLPTFRSTWPARRVVARFPLLVKGRSP